MSLYEKDADPESNGLFGILGRNADEPPEFEEWCRGLRQQVAERAEYIENKRSES